MFRRRDSSKPVVGSVEQSHGWARSGTDATNKPSNCTPSPNTHTHTQLDCLLPFDVLSNPYAALSIAIAVTVAVSSLHVHHCAKERNKHDDKLIELVLAGDAGKVRSLLEKKKYTSLLSPDKLGRIS